MRSYTSQLHLHYGQGEKGIRYAGSKLIELDERKNDRRTTSIVQLTKRCLRACRSHE